MALPYLGPSWLLLSLAATALSQAQSPPSCLATVRGLHLDSLPGPVPTYYSASFRGRAERDQALLRDAGDSSRTRSVPTRPPSGPAERADWRRVNCLCLTGSLTSVTAFLPATDDVMITMDVIEVDAVGSVRAKIARE